MPVRRPVFAIVLSLASFALLACRSQRSFILEAPGSVVPGTLMVGILDTSEISPVGWSAVFAHKRDGAWAVDTSVSLAPGGFLLLDKFRFHHFWSKGAAEADTFRIQVLEGAKVRDESVMVMN